MLDRFLARIEGRQAVVGIVGLGYVGLPLALRFAEEGFRVVGFDRDQAKIARLAAGQSYIGHIGAGQIAAAQQAGMTATADMARAAEVDALVLCLPTPLDRHREPDLSFVLDTLDALLPHLRAGQLLSLESTTYPGTTDEALAPRIAARGFTLGTDFFLAYSPEREDPANDSITMAAIPKLCAGQTAACQRAALALYGSAFEQVVPVSSTRTAEMAKLLENIHRSVNIGLANEMKVVADRMGIDIYEVIRAAATKPFGFVPYYPGPGVGGHCIPVDPFYLTWKAREYGVHTRFIELAGEVNGAMPDYVIGKLVQALNRHRRSVAGSRILLLGLAYKRNVDDVRESPSVELLVKLQELGAQVDYSDPHVPSFPAKRSHRLDLASRPLDAATLAEYDCVLLATDHDAFDYELIRQRARLIVDTRGRFRDGADHIVRA
ncbi:nucleotide sugar dehydrogenase [Chitinimonas koreensis]|uniref:nucleotide sugar dehydrogenase n=1 Tax=Chitinimonas koreensis TaxID=356302 RepID=UPI00048CA10D|nr:nucleotide sugar dehydrogenase [Chitinimonas koreensis]QNM97375.1 nucleotide sugar dehydrogenase [Chitinimonas koreensis]